MNNDRLTQIEMNLRSVALDRRKAALDELATFSPDVAVPILQKLARDPEFILRRLAVMGFGNHHSETSFQALQEVLKYEQDANVLAEAANSLFEFGDRAIATLHQLFEHSNNWLVRHTIISLLVETNQYEVLLAVAQEALKDKEQAVKEVGILALNRLLRSPLKDRALALLTELAEDGNWRNRWRTATALQNCQDPQAKLLIAKLQQDEHYRVVAAALEVASQ